VLGGSRSLLVALLASTSACTSWWAPHSLVSSDRPIREAVLVGKRVEAKVCNANILGFIALDENHLMASAMDQLHEAAPQAVAFQDLRFDESFSVFIVYNERCLLASAQPVFPVPTIPRERAPADEQPMRRKPEATPPPPEKPADDDTNKTPEQLEQELQLGAPPTAPPK